MFNKYIDTILCNIIVNKTHLYTFDNNNMLRCLLKYKTYYEIKICEVNNYNTRNGEKY